MNQVLTHKYTVDNCHKEYGMSSLIVTKIYILAFGISLTMKVALPAVFL